MKTIEIYWLAIKYFIQQGFTNWKYAKAYARFIIEGDSHVSLQG